MSGPIVFISYHHVKDNKLAELKENFERVSAMLNSRDANTIMFEAYTNQRDDQISFVHVFPDGAAMASHVKGADERSRTAREFLRPIRFEIFGDPGAEVMEMMRKASGERIELHWKPNPFGGFHRYGVDDGPPPT